MEIPGDLRKFLERFLKHAGVLDSIPNYSLGETKTRILGDKLLETHFRNRFDPHRPYAGLVWFETEATCLSDTIALGNLMPN
jgi:hypothetical protein